MYDANGKWFFSLSPESVEIINDTLDKAEHPFEIDAMFMRVRHENVDDLFLEIYSGLSDRGVKISRGQIRHDYIGRIWMIEAVCKEWAIRLGYDQRKASF